MAPCSIRRRSVRYMGLPRALPAVGHRGTHDGRLRENGDRSRASFCSNPCSRSFRYRFRSLMPSIRAALPRCPWLASTARLMWRAPAPPAWTSAGRRDGHRRPCVAGRSAAGRCSGRISAPSHTIIAASIDVQQLAHVARPGVPPQRLQRRRRRARFRHPNRSFSARRSARRAGRCRPRARAAAAACTAIVLSR